jgi:hypothetical protein
MKLRLQVSFDLRHLLLDINFLTFMAITLPIFLRDDGLYSGNPEREAECFPTRPKARVIDRLRSGIFVITRQDPRLGVGFHFGVFKMFARSG